MGLLDGLYRDFVHDRRARVLCGHLAPLIPPGARVLDRLLTDLISLTRLDASITGVDVLVQDHTRVLVEKLDG